MGTATWMDPLSYLDKVHIALERHDRFPLQETLEFNDRGATKENIVFII
jgi:hypothetical protein